MLFAAQSGMIWHAIPLVAVVSLVYGATRHELWRPILHHAYRTAVWIVGFIFIVVSVLAIVSSLV
jgi:hypothetical protein